MDTATLEKEDVVLFKALDKGIDDMENNRVTPHKETMEELKRRYKEYVLQNP
jgi:hypothetical protein